jgi:hypothetical protein
MDVVDVVDVVGVVGRVVVVLDDAVVEVLDEVVEDDVDVWCVVVVAPPEPEVPHPAITVTAATTIGTDMRYLRRTFTRAPWEGRSCHPCGAPQSQGVRISETMHRLKDCGSVRLPDTGPSSKKRGRQMW